MRDCDVETRSSAPGFKRSRTMQQALRPSPRMAARAPSVATCSWGGGPVVLPRSAPSSSGTQGAASSIISNPGVLGATRGAHRALAPPLQAAKKLQVATVAPQAAPSSGEAIPQAVSVAIMASSVYAGLLILAMAFAPRVAAVRRTVQSLWVFAPLGLTYLALLALSWTPDTLATIMPGSLAEGLSGGFKPQFFPRLEGISALFSQPATAASWVLHILAINLVLARSIYLDGLTRDVPTTLSVLVASVVGPLGLLLHWLTRWLISAVPALNPEAREREMKSPDGGRIIILPYDRAS